MSDHFALNLGARYDLQTFATKRLLSNPLWPGSGRVPLDQNNIALRIGLAYSIGDQRPLVIRAGYGRFFTRIPQIYNAVVESDNGLNGGFLFLNNRDALARPLFPQYPNTAVGCLIGAVVCRPSAELTPFLGRDLSAFSSNFQIPRVDQASVNVEREIANRFAAGMSYMYVHGENLIRSRDVDLPPPVTVPYPVFDASGATFLGSYHNVDSFSTLQFTRSLDCIFPPCINTLARPIPQLSAIEFSRVRLRVSTTGQPSRCDAA